MRIYFAVIAVAIMIAGSMAFPVVASAQEDEQLVIRAIEIRGNEVIPDQEILSVMQGRAGEVFSLNTLSTDLAAIEAMGWFATEPEHILEPWEGGVKIIIVLVENPYYGGTIVEQTGPGIYSKAELAMLFELSTSELVNNNAVTAGLQAIERRYREAGYTAATISDIDIDENGVVHVTVNEGVISDIVVQGNTKTRTHVIMREIQTQIGEVFNAVTFRRDLERIYNLQLFEDIQPSFELDENRQVVLYINVIEARTGQFGFGGGYSSNDGLLATLSYSERNFRGLGQSISAMGQFGGPNPDVQVSFFNPVIDNQRTSFNIEGFMLNETDRIRDPEDPEVVTRFELERRGGSIGVVRPMSDDVTLALTLRFLDGEVTFIDEEGNALPPDEIPELDDNEWVNQGLIDGAANSLVARLAYDTRDFTLDPSQGSVFSIQTSMIGQFLGGDFDAMKYEAEVRQFIPLTQPPEDISSLSPTRYRRQHVLAFRILYGTSTGDLPLIERFKIGGQNSVRGTDETAQAGDQALLFNAEYRFPLGGNLSGCVFFDTGTAALPGDSLSFNNMVTTVGIGIRYRVSFFGIAPLRLDYGYDIDEGDGQIVFGFGHLF
jgi:outer membrane protein insertion porin family